MMSHEQWLNTIVEVVKEIASERFQRDAWLSGRPSTSSPTEMYNQLFDDYTFDLFFDTYSEGFTPIQDSAWKELKARLTNFSEKYPIFPDEQIVFEDADWKMVRKAAADFVAAFDVQSQSAVT